MCDCYEHKCVMCDETIPMHIGDFKYPRHMFEAYCYRHIKHAPKGSVMFKLTRKAYNWGKWFPKGWKCAIHGPEVGGPNHLNLSGDFTIERID